MNFIEALKALIIELGAGGIFVATTLEYGCFPVSSEILLPFIGYVVAVNGSSLPVAIGVATLGGLVGTTACYSVGRLGSGLFDCLAGRFRGIALGVEKAQGLFERYGRESVFFARLFPIARTYISFPAGLGKMPLVPFVLYTGLGVVIWNTALIGAGYFLGVHWDICKAVLHTYRWQLTGVLLLLVLWLVYKKRRTVQ